MTSPRPHRVRIADVAEAAGVSKTAVSFAFNNPARLADVTATRIRAIADELGYRPDPVARMLSQGRTRALGVLTPQPLSVVFSNPFFGTLCEGVGQVADETGYGLYLLSPLHGSLAEAVGRAGVDGVIAIGLSEAEPEIAGVRRSGLPIVFVDPTGPTEAPSIEVDDRSGARAAAEHLVGLGHRDILVIAMEPALPGDQADPQSVIGRRLLGYRDGLAGTGTEPAHDRLVTAPSTVSGGAASIRRAWRGRPRPTAVLAMSDAIALGVLRGAADLGIDVPSILSVVGFDDVEMAALARPPLTTVHQPVRQKGDEAARLLLELIDGRTAGSEHRRLETQLVVRESTGPAPAAASPSAPSSASVPSSAPPRVSRPGGRARPGA